MFKLICFRIDIKFRLKNGLVRTFFELLSNRKLDCLTVNFYMKIMTIYGTHEEIICEFCNRNNVICERVKLCLFIRLQV